MRATLRRCVPALVLGAFSLVAVAQAPAVAPATTAAVDAKAAQAATEKYFCSGCHQLDAKIVGPAWKDVAAKYKADKDAVEKLAGRVKKGSVNVWGAIPMPANESVPDADVKLIVTWILSQ